MEQFTIRLNNVADSYYGFVVAVLSYVKNIPYRMSTVNHYMDENPEALSSDILEFISDQDDFYDDPVENFNSNNKLFCKWLRAYLVCL